MLSRAFLRVASYPSAQPILLQHQPCCSTRPATFGQFASTRLGPKSRAARGLMRASRGRQQAPGTRQQAGSKHQAGGREVEENAEAKLKAIFHTSRCENHCTVLLFC